MKIIVDNLLIFVLIISAFLSAFFFWAGYMAKKRVRQGKAYFIGGGLIFLAIENLPYLLAYIFF